MRFSSNRRPAITYLLDSSVWLALAVERHTFHASAKAFFDQRTEPNSVPFCRATQQSFLRLLTTSSILRAYELTTTTNQEAWELYDAIESHLKVGFIAESVDVEPFWRSFSSLKTASPKVWMDSYLAAFAIGHDHTLVTFDHDFKQFPGLKLEVIL